MSAAPPSMVSPAESVMVGSAYSKKGFSSSSVMVAEEPRSKPIASSPLLLPAEQPSLAALLLAACIASLSEQSPSVLSSSASVLTVMVVPEGCALGLGWEGRRPEDQQQ